MKTKSPWYQSNSDLFAHNREKFGKQPEHIRIKAVNSIDSEKYANGVIASIMRDAIKYGAIDPDTRFNDVCYMLASGEL